MNAAFGTWRYYIETSSIWSTILRQDNLLHHKRIHSAKKLYTLSEEKPQATKKKRSSRVFYSHKQGTEYIKFDKGITDNIQVYLMKEYSAIVESSELMQNKEHTLTYWMCSIKWWKM